MTPEQVMKTCQVGCHNLNAANDLLAQCYGTIGKLLIDLQAARAALEVVSLSDYETLKSEHDALKHAVGRLMEHDFAENCQECGIGQSDAWAEVKTIIAGAGVRVKP